MPNDKQIPCIISDAELQVACPPEVEVEEIPMSWLIHLRGIQEEVANSTQQNVESWLEAKMHAECDRISYTRFPTPEEAAMRAEAEQGYPLAFDAPILRDYKYKM